MDKQEHRQFGSILLDNAVDNKKQKVETRTHFNKRGVTEKPDE